MRELEPACPPGARGSMIRVRRPGADHDQVVEFLSGLDAEADAAGKQFEVRVNEHRAVGKDQHGKLRGIELAILE